MSKFKPDRPSSTDSLQVKKSKLEIIDLWKKTRWFATPTITALISVAGLVISVIVFGSQQRSEQDKNRLARDLERRTSLQNQIRGDTEEILRFTGDPKLSVSRAAFLLSDIQTVLNSPINDDQKLVDVLPAYKEGPDDKDVMGYKESLTRSLVTLVRDDCDFVRHARDVELANAVVAYWPDYSTYLTKDPNLERLDYILWEYTQALQSVRDQNPGYLRSFYLNKDKELDTEYGKRRNEHLLYNHLIDIADGFKMHLRILCKEGLGDIAQQKGKIRLKEFETGLLNPIVSDELIKKEINRDTCKPLRDEEQKNGNQEKSRKKVRPA
jgi:hypothetical protein